MTEGNMCIYDVINGTKAGKLLTLPSVEATVVTGVAVRSIAKAWVAVAIAVAAKEGKGLAGLAGFVSHQEINIIN